MPLPTAKRAVPVSQCQQRRHQQFAHHFERGWRRNLYRFVTGEKVGQQPDRVQLCRRTARQHAAIFAHHIAKRLYQSRFAKQPPRLAVGEQQPCGNDPGPACDLSEARARARGLLVEPRGGFGYRGQQARFQRLVMARQHQRGVHQPGDQPQPGVFNLPRWPLARCAIGVEPLGGDPFGHDDAIGARGAGGEVGKPAETVQHPLYPRRMARSGREIEVGNRQARAVDQEMSCAQRRARRAITAIGAFHRRQHAQRRRAAERRGQRVSRHADAIGQPDQRLSRPGLHRDHVTERKRARGFFGLRFGRKLWALDRPRLCPVGQAQHRIIRHLFDQRIGAAASRRAQQRRHHRPPLSAAILAA